MTQEKLKQKLFSLVVENSDADFSDYSNICDAIDDLLSDTKIPAKNLGQKPILKGIAWGYIDDIFYAIENKYKYENRDFTSDEEQELEEIIEHIAAFIIRFYNK
jgi:hypothetical protein